MYIHASTLVSSLGAGKQKHLKALENNQTGLSNQTAFQQTLSLNTFLGEVAGLDAEILPDHLASFHCRNNLLAWKTLHTDQFIDRVKQAIDAFGGDRIGIVVGTSTSGIAETEKLFSQPSYQHQYNYERTNQMGSLAAFCREALQIQGPGFVISTACSSSAKVFATARRWLNADLVDAVIVGGVDSLCLTTIHGFDALDLVSDQPCQPLDKDRKGINIGEAGGFALVSNVKPDNQDNLNPVKVTGIGESSDAYHISAPHPQGDGAAAAMKQALQQAKLSPEQIDYINLHGTSTPSNDISEIKSLAQFEDQPFNAKLSSTKGFTGHTLGAAGITDILFCQWALQHQLIPGNLNLVKMDPESEKLLKRQKLHVIQESETANVRISNALSNSFGFGGNNASIILQLEPEK